jgi:ABC-type multidrug transport system fused ATPase/permease subunit
MLTVGFALLGFVMLLKVLYLVATNHFQNVQVSKIRSSLELRLFDRYLRADYRFHLNANSTSLSRNLLTEIDYVAGYAFTPLISLTVEVTTVLGITALLLYVQPIATVAMVVFFVVSGAGYLKIVDPVLRRFGSQRPVIVGERLRTIAETLGGIKQVKVLGRESYFWTRFSRVSELNAHLAARSDTLLRIPAHLVELFGVLGLLVVVFTLIVQDRNMSSIVSSLGLYVGASFKLVPSLNRILIALQALRIAKSSVDTVFGDMSKPGVAESPRRAIRLKDALTFRGVSFRYQDSLPFVLEGVSLSLRKGESIGIVGDSGAGKTSLVDLILGLLTPTSGQVFIDGDEIDPAASTWRANVGYVSQEIFLTDDTIRNNVAFGVPADEISESQIVKSLQTAQLWDFVKNLPEGLDTTVGERGVRISGGQRQRIGIARALYHDPSLLILDEATSALDLETEKEFIETLEAVHKKVTMVVVSHRMSTLKYCDRIFRIENGKLSEARSA